MYKKTDLVIFAEITEFIIAMEKVVRTKIKDLLKMQPGQEVLAKGWVRTKRGNKQVKFIALNDGSTINNIQIVAEAELFDEDLMKKITTGASLGVRGQLVESLGSERHFSGISQDSSPHEIEDQYFRSNPESKERHGFRYPLVLPEQRFRISSHTAHH